MTPAQTAATVVLGLLAWFGLAACLAIAIGLTIRAADERQDAADEQAQREPAESLAEVVPLQARRGTRLDVRL